MHSLVSERPTIALGGRSRPEWLAAWATRLGLDTAYLLLGLPAGVLTFTVVVTGWATALGLAITLIGLPIALATILVSRGMAQAERWRAALVLGEPIRARYPPPPTGRVIDRLKAVFADRQTWKDLGWHLLLLPIGLVGFTVAVVVWCWSLWCLTFPLWFKITPAAADFGDFTLDTWWWALLVFTVGLVTLPLTVALLRGTAAGTGALARLLLGSDAEELEERVEVLTETRAGAVDAAAAELERIERDLHDGAQARLVALAMDLGMAEERFERDPDGARELVEKARDEAKQALAELRDLARGMRPALLAERGLEEAIRALAARTKLPTTVAVEPGGRLAPAVESAAYFVVAEALTNAVKHSRATRLTVDVARDGDLLVVQVADDGDGGADPSGSGLTGLRKRLEALDGELRIASPRGGPTLLHAEIPCAS
ncbi:MAG TPA: sensor histidine kinase [Solirubrobacteraceae bacterium]|nr:sensor histidine kinase [Solirubrobacteraceae bacterium]